jgi:hypothetical protein
MHLSILSDMTYLLIFMKFSAEILMLLKESILLVGSLTPVKSPLRKLDLLDCSI